MNKKMNKWMNEWMNEWTWSDWGYSSLPPRLDPSSDTPHSTSCLHHHYVKCREAFISSTISTSAPALLTFVKGIEPEQKCIRDGTDILVFSCGISGRIFNVLFSIPAIYSLISCTYPVWFPIQYPTFGGYLTKLQGRICGQFHGPVYQTEYGHVTAFEVGTPSTPYHIIILFF